LHLLAFLVRAQSTAAQDGGDAMGWTDHHLSTPPAGADRPALVLVHGHPFNCSMWQPQVQQASADGWRVIAPDLRGYGGAAAPRGAVTTLEDFARDLATLLDRLGVRTALMAGLSMGGQIVMEFQRLFPHRVTGLLLAATSEQPETDEGRRLRNETADRLQAHGMDEYAEELLPRMLTTRTVAEQPHVAHHVRQMMRGTSATGAAAALRGRALRPDYTPVLAAVTVPTLVVVGSEDSYTSVDDARRTHRLVPGASLEVIDGAGHMPNLEKPQQFNAALHQLLNRVGSPS
jgi:pimeloyl-ACP methyl ester carboxylesterase